MDRPSSILETEGCLERVSQSMTILVEDGRSKLRGPTKTVGVNHFAIRFRGRYTSITGDGADRELQTQGLFEQCCLPV